VCVRRTIAIHVVLTSLHSWRIFLVRISVSHAHRLRCPSLQHHADTLLEHAPDGMAAADGEALRGDPRVRDAFGKCLRHAYCKGARGMAQDVRVLGGKWALDLERIQCK
jgi:hypothetical protein